MPRHVMLVADDHKQLRQLQGDLQSYGLNVEIVASERFRFCIDRGTSADVIILTMEQPQGEHFHLCHTFTTNPATAHIPIILLSYCDEASAVLAAFQAGAQDYIIQDTFTTHNLVESLRCLRIL